MHKLFKITYILSIIFSLASCDPVLAATKVPAKDVTLDTSGFTKNLDSSTTDVQKLAVKFDQFSTSLTETDPVFTAWLGATPPIYTEVDPKVGTLQNGKWCSSNGSTVSCTEDAPSAVGALSDLTDVSITSAATNDVLKYNGSIWVNVPVATTFDFSVASFSSGQSTPQLIGTGTWKAAAAISFTASYTNGPATAAYISKAGWSNLTLSSPFTSGTSAESVAYPSVGSTVTFTLHASKSAATVTSTSSVSFYNDIFYGVSTKASGYTGSDVTGLATSVISNTKGRTITVSPGATEYIIYALPVRLGTVVFTVGGFEGGFQDPEMVSVTNSAGYAENFYVYRSTNLNLGSTTVVVS